MNFATVLEKIYEISCFAHIYTNNFAWFRESLAFIRESNAFIRENYALIRENYH